MAADLILRHPDLDTSAVGDLDLRYQNTVNTPISSCTDLENGQLIAGQYTLLWADATTLSVTAADGSKNPNHDASVSVTCDGSTPNLDVILGASLVFSASCTTGWTAVVSVGAKMTALGVMTRTLDVGVIDAGSSSSNQQVTACNIGSDDAVECDIQAMPAMYWTQSGAGDIVDLIDNHTDDTREHSASAGSYAITFANWGNDPGGSGKKSCDILVDGNTAVATAVMDGATRYQYGVAAYDDINDYAEGLSFILADSTDDPSAVTITLTVMEGWQWVELAEDSGGSPGSWGSGPVDLTESGETTGTITSSGKAYAHTRWSPPDGTSPSDLRGYRLGLRGKSI